MEKTEDRLLSIGVIARSFGVSENCIRRMEAAGLLKPAFVSEESGYRYYDSADIAQIGSILTLRSFGFTNRDIGLFMTDPDNLPVLYHKLQDMSRTITDLLRQLSRRLKTDEPYKCEIASFGEAFCYTKEAVMVPSLSRLSGAAADILFEAIRRKLPVDYMHPMIIETYSTDYRTFDPGAEQRILFHIPLRENREGPEITRIPQTRAVDVKWSYPGTAYSGILPSIDGFFEIMSLKQAGTLRATFDMSDYSIKNSDISDTVMHILIPVS